MRITGGAWRGRRLLAVPKSEVRPTTDMVREALFSILGDLLADAAVADLCCGSGALGLEALSRGAASVDFVDLAPISLATARENLQRCGADAGRWRLHRADAARWLSRRLQAGGPPLLVLADPPYGGPLAEAFLEQAAAAAPGSLLAAAIEHPREQPLAAGPLEGTSWRLESRSYGRTTLTMLRPWRAPATEADHA